jgi:hypothetical protein
LFYEVFTVPVLRNNQILLETFIFANFQYSRGVTWEYLLMGGAYASANVSVHFPDFQSRAIPGRVGDTNVDAGVYPGTNVMVDKGINDYEDKFKAGLGLPVDLPLSPDTPISINVPATAAQAITMNPAQVLNISDVAAPPVVIPEGGIHWGRFSDITFFSKFPFCLPWDLYTFVSALMVEPKEPVFELDLFPESVFGKWGMSSGPLILDFREFEVIVRLFRSGMLILFIIGLIVMTKNYIWTGGG